MARRAPQGAAGPAAPPALDAGDVAMFRMLAARTGRPVESQLNGGSMGGAIPGGSRIRITHRPGHEWRAGEVIAFVAGSRVMVHRIVHVGSRGPARRFVLTQGDGNWLCDPPVELGTIAGLVEQYWDAGAWRPVPEARVPALRRLLATPTLALFRLALEWSPATASRLGRVASHARMGLRGAWLKARRVGTLNVRH